jgi:hypothetical protein
LKNRSTDEQLSRLLVGGCQIAFKAKAARAGNKEQGKPINPSSRRWEFQRKTLAIPNLDSPG